MIGKIFSEAQPEEERDADDSHCDPGQQIEQGIDDIGLYPVLATLERFQHNKLRGALLVGVNMICGSKSGKAMPMPKKALCCCDHKLLKILDLIQWPGRGSIGARR